jgi:hypothetical protein
MQTCFSISRLGFALDKDSNHRSCPTVAKQSRTDSEADALDLKQELNKVQTGANLLYMLVHKDSVAIQIHVQYKQAITSS